MELKNIYDIARVAGIDEKYIEPYGKYKAKIDLDIFKDLKDKKDGKLVLVTAITPTKAGEGKTTISIALHEGLRKINENSLICLREPSLGPVFGLKGGATGGGKVTVEPSEDINLHFTGDMHALTSSINLIAAVLDNELYQGNSLRIDPNRIVWKRAMDMNERTLRDIRIGRGEKNGYERNGSFLITVASELMAILCLASDEEDFVKRLKNITVAYDEDGNRITVDDLRVSKAVMKLMKEALKPNLVQTGENNPALIHGGPFANIAHGCNSLIALKLGLKLSDIVVTEAGFGSDLGAEKFLDILCNVGSLRPDLVVMVATVKALKLHGGVAPTNLNETNVEALKVGVANLKQHLENMKKYGLNPVIAFNHFESDKEEEIDYIMSWGKENGYRISFVDGFLRGGEGSTDLARIVKEELAKNEGNYHSIYDVNSPLKDKIETIAREIYRADGVNYSSVAEAKLKEFEEQGFKNAYICVAKTPASFSDNDALINAPRGFKLNVKDVSLSSGANFVVCYTGEIMTMPGLPKVPAAVKMEDQ